MATSDQVVVRNEHFYCSICLEIYHTPRTLPCLHSFCHDCLKGYILKISEKQQKQSLFCPVCRADTKTDNHKFKQVEKWVGNFPINFTLLSILKERKSAMNPKENYCEACLREDIKSEAIVYCYDCSEKLCEDCKRHHKKNKLLSNHKLIDTSDGCVNNLNHEEFEYLAKLSKCPVHGTEEVKYLCKDHDQLCCNECAIVTHRKCEDMVSLNDEIKAKREESTDSRIEKRLDTIDSYIEKLIEHESKYSANLCRNENDTKAYLKDLKEKLDAAYKKLESRIIMEMLERKQALSKASSLQRESAEILKGDVEQCGDRVKNARTNGSEMHLYLLEREMSNQLTEYEETFTTLREQSSKSLITMTEASPLQEVIRKIENLYQIKEVEEKPSLPPFKQTKDFKSRELSVECEVSLNEDQPCYCLWIGNYIIVSFEYISKLVAYKADDGSPLSTYQCPLPTAVTATGNDEFAVALPSSNKINVMKIKKKLICLRKLTCSRPDVIAYDKRSRHIISLSRSDQVIRKLKLDGRDAGCIDLSSIVKQILQNTYNIHVDSQRGNIFISSYDSHTLLCLDMSGNLLFQHYIKQPWSVITDTQGNIYIASFSAHCIQQLYPNGQLIKANILGESKVSNPMAMSFNKDMNKLAVTSTESGGKLRLFKFE